MPSGSIPHDQQRPQKGKRHGNEARNVQSAQHASDDVENMPLEELEWQMDKTLNEILYFTRLYMLQYNERWERTGEGYWGCGHQSVGWFVSRAHWEGDARDIEEQHNNLENGVFLP